MAPAPVNSNGKLRKQDLFWEGIIVKYEHAVRQLREDARDAQQQLYELKVLVQAIVTFNLIKLMNKGGDPQLVNRVMRMQCICGGTQPAEEQPLVIGDVNSIFDIHSADIQYMDQIKALIARETELIDNVNQLRIKDNVLVQMKVNMDKLMKTVFPDQYSTTTGGPPSTMPQETVALLRTNRGLNDELCNLRKENDKSQDTLHGALVHEIVRMQRKGDALEAEVACKKRELTNIFDCDNVSMLEGILQRSKRSVADLEQTVSDARERLDERRRSVAALKKL